MTKGVEDGMSDEQAKQLLRDLVEITTGWTFSDIKDAQSNALGVIGQQAWEIALRAKELLAAVPVAKPAAVPVEEADAKLLAALDEVRGKTGQTDKPSAVGSGSPQTDYSRFDRDFIAGFNSTPPAAVPVEERTLRKTCYCNEIWCPTCYPPVPIAKPIPEERTAEMEQLMETIEKALNASRIALDSNTLARRLLAISMIEKGWAAIAAIKRDHIEGLTK